nr:helix-turn-helix transcriptional regulator [Pseudenhygromyxa sp. WMMC2535]
MRRLTEVRGISLAAVADRSGIDRRELFAVMAGEVDPSLDWLNGLADGLGVRLAELFEEPPGQPPP